MRIGIVVGLLLTWLVAAPGSADVVPQQEASIQSSTKSMPVAFTENKGQWPDSILFRADAGGAVVWITRTGVYYQLTRGIPKELDKALDDPSRLTGKWDHERDSIETILVKAAFIGSNPEPEVVTEGLMEYKCNYFIGNDQTKWATDVPNYEAVILREIYDGIGLRISGGPGPRLAYQYELEPGADLAQVRPEYQRPLGMANQETADVERAWVELADILSRPTTVKAYCRKDGAESTTHAATVDRKPTEGLQFQALDLIFSTYLGGSIPDNAIRGQDYAYAIAVDGSGAAYVTGETWSTDFPTQDPFQYNLLYNDVFISKLSAQGDLIYSTYLGGSDNEAGYDIEIDGAGNMYMVGSTKSSNFPTQDAYDATYNGRQDVFVSKLSGDGNSLIFGTYLGGDQYDYGFALAVDLAGNTYVTGATESSDFPFQGGYDGSFNGGYLDVFVTRLSNSGGSILYSTYLGGNYDEIGRGIAVDDVGNAYVAGFTNSADFPTQNAFDATANGDRDAFVTKLPSTGANLVYSTFLGGSEWEEALAIATLENGDAVTMGWTGSSNFPVQNPLQALSGSQDIFITRLSNNGTSLVYSTYLGGTSWEEEGSLALDKIGSAYVTGVTYSSDFPVQNGYDESYNGGLDVFITKISSQGTSIDYSTYLGGLDDDYGKGIAVGDDGSIYVTGHTESTNFPTQNPVQLDQGGTDAFVARLSGRTTLADKQAIIDFFSAETFYADAEEEAQSFLDLVQSHVDAGTATSKELEAVLRLLLLEEAAKAAYGTVSEPGADSLTTLTARCTLKAATALLLKLAFDKLEKVMRPLKDVPLLKWFYNKVAGASAWFNSTLHSFNRQAVTSVFNRLTPVIMSQYGLSQAEAQSMAMQVGWDFIKAGESKVAGVALDQASEPLLQSLLSELNRWVYETGVPLYTPPSSPPSPLYIGGTKHSLEEGVDEAASGAFLEGGAASVSAEIRDQQIPAIEDGNSTAISRINDTITAAFWAEIGQLVLFGIILLGLIVALVASLISCPAAAGITCVLGAISGVGIWGTLLKITNLLSWAKIVLYATGMGVGAYQLHAHLPAQLREAKYISFDEAPKVYLETRYASEVQSYQVTGQWSDSLTVAASETANRLEVVRAHVADSDWEAVLGSMAGLDSALQYLAEASNIAGTYLGYTLLTNQSDTLPALDTLYGYSMAHSTANDLSLALCQVALGFASVAEPEGADRDSMLMLVDETIARLREVGPAFDTTFTEFGNLGLTVPPIVVITAYELFEDSVGKHLVATAQNVSGVEVHDVSAELKADDSLLIPIVPETDTSVPVLSAGEERVFMWHVDASTTDTVFQLKLLIEPAQLPGDFVGDSRIITAYYPTETYEYLCGDVTAEGMINVSDLTYLIGYLFRGGPEPGIMDAADVNGVIGINVGDVTYLIAYLFRGGAAPVCP